MLGSGPEMAKLLSVDFNVNVQAKIFLIYLGSRFVVQASAKFIKPKHFVSFFERQMFEQMTIKNNLAIKETYLFPLPYQRA